MNMQNVVWRFWLMNLGGTKHRYSTPESIGADVKMLKLKAENNFLPDLDELKSYVNENTKLICINNPNNPTGAVMDEDFLIKIVDIAKSCGAYLLCVSALRRSVQRIGSLLV